VVVCCIVIDCVDVAWILHFILHDHIVCWLRDGFAMDALLVIRSHIEVLKNDIHE
jgi:hypothetical protein